MHSPCCTLRLVVENAMLGLLGSRPPQSNDYYIVAPAPALIMAGTLAVGSRV
jgi:hypothetical protein